MKTVIANWKMNVGVRESVALARGTLLTLRGRKIIPDLVICPPFVALGEVRKVIARSSVELGAQNTFWEATGSHTGETSTRMLQEHGVTHVILGHSERRQQVGETDEMIHMKHFFERAVRSYFVHWRNKRRTNGRASTGGDSTSAFCGSPRSAISWR